MKEGKANELVQIYLENLEPLTKQMFDVFWDEVAKIEKEGVQFELHLNIFHNEPWINLVFENKYDEHEKILVAIGSGDKLNKKDLIDINISKSKLKKLIPILENLFFITSNDLFEVCLNQLVKKHIKNKEQDINDTYLNDMFQQHLFRKICNPVKNYKHNKL